MNNIEMKIRDVFQKTTIINLNAVALQRRQFTSFKNNPYYFL
jgi:hypothetical protein